jgi:hypothetical protein
LATAPVKWQAKSTHGRTLLRVRLGFYYKVETAPVPKWNGAMTDGLRYILCFKWHLSVYDQHTKNKATFKQNCRIGNYNSKRQKFDNLKIETENIAENHNY